VVMDGSGNRAQIDPATVDPPQFLKIGVNGA